MVSKTKFKDRKRLTTASTKTRSFTGLNEEESTNEANSDEALQIKKQTVVVIDDNDPDGDESHKPWITPALIKLIKQRNLLQSKLYVDGEEPNQELLNKFKNLRNKVTKLVKNARSLFFSFLPFGHSTRFRMRIQKVR